MATKKWVLADAASDLHVDEWTIRSEDMGISKPFSVTQKVLKAGLSRGVDSIRVDNGRCRFDILPTRGMGIWKAWLGDEKNGYEEIGWKSPVRGPVHPQWVDLGEPGGLGWLDGFDELLVRCGLENNGAPEFDETTGRLKYTLHGRIGNRPAHYVEVAVDGDSGEISVRGVVEETRFHFLKLRMTSTVTTRLGEPGFRIVDEIENLSAGPAEAQMLYHANFGAPLLDGGSRIVAPVKTVVPRNDHAASGIKNWDSYGAEQPGFEEQVYFLELLGDASGNTMTLLKNAHGTRGVGMRFNVKQLPCFSVWKNTTAMADGYVTGIEPGTNYPNPRSYEGEQGRVIRLGARAKTTLTLGFAFQGTSAEVEKAEKQIAQLQGSHIPKVFDKPQAGWCAM